MSETLDTRGSTGIRAILVAQLVRDGAKVPAVLVRQVAKEEGVPIIKDVEDPQNGTEK